MMYTCRRAVTVHGIAVAAGFLSVFAVWSGRASAQERCEVGTPVPDLGVTLETAMFTAEPLVSVVNAKGPAAGKLQPGDYISRVNGYPVGTGALATSALRESPPGRAVVLTVRRSGRLLPVTVTPTRAACPAVSWLQPTRTAWALEPLEVESASVAGTITLARSPAAGGWLGLAFECTECEQRTTPDGGVWVFREKPKIYNVDTNSPAYTAGIRRGDVLLRVDGADVQTSRAGARLGEVKPGESLRLTYQRGGRTSEALVRVTRNPAAAEIAIDKVAAADLLRSTHQVRKASMDLELVRLLGDLERARSAQSALIRDFERQISKTDSEESRATRAMLQRIEQLQEETFRNQQRALQAALQSEREEVKQLSVVERRLAEAASAATYQQIAPARAAVVGGGRAVMRDDRPRYSGSIGGSDVEVRGPGSVSVQRVGNDLVIITGDAVVRITERGGS